MAQLNIVLHQNDKATLGVSGWSFSKHRLVSSIFHPTGRQGFFLLFSVLLFHSIFTVCRSGRAVKGESDMMATAPFYFFLESQIREFICIQHSVSVLNAETSVQQEICSDLRVQAGRHIQYTCSYCSMPALLLLSQIKFSRLVHQIWQNVWTVHFSPVNFVQIVPWTNWTFCFHSVPLMNGLAHCVKGGVPDECK